MAHENLEGLKVAITGFAQEIVAGHRRRTAEEHRQAVPG